METYSVELAEELKKLVELNVYCLRGKSDGSPPGGFSIFLFFLTSLLRCLKCRTVDVLHVGDMALWPVAFFFRLLNNKTSLVISAHGTDVAYHLRAGSLPVLYRWYLALGALMVDSRIRVVANSHATAAHCRVHGFRNVYVVPLGVRIRQEIEHPYSGPRDYILFVGRLARRKGVGWFIDSVLPQLPEGVSLKVAGTVWDDAEFNAVKGSSRTEYLGPVYGDELAELRRNAIAVIMPNIVCEGRDFEGFGLTAVEAAADGAVLVASGIDGIVDAVIDGKSGWLLPVGDSVTWKNKIDEIMHWELDKRIYFVTQARAAIAQFYSWERVAHNTLEIYIKRTP